MVYSFQKHGIAASKVLIFLSALPSVCAWYEADIRDVFPKERNIYYKKDSQIILSVWNMNISSMPWFTKTGSAKSWAAIFEFQDRRISVKSTIFVKQSTEF